MIRTACLLVSSLSLLMFLGLHFPASTYAENPPATSLVERYRRALEVDPDNLKLRYYLGVALLSRDQPKDALTELRRAYPEYQNSVEANYNLGIAYLQVGDSDSALLHLEQAEALGAAEQPEIYPLVDAYFNLALMNFDQDNRAEAIRLFTRVLALNPERREVERLIGDLYARDGRDDEALAAFARYLEAFPDDASIREYVFSLHFNRAMQALEVDDLIGSRRALDSALATSPGSPLAQYYLGYLDYREANLAAAVPILQEAYGRSEGEVREGIRSLLYNVALQILDQRKPKAALDALSVLLVESDVSVDELFLAGNIHLMLSEFVAARDRYEAVLRKEPLHEGATLNLVTAEAGALDELFADGRTLYDQQDYLLALSRFEEMLKINPADPRAKRYREDSRSILRRQAESYFSAATASLAEGEALQALETVRQGLALVPEHPDGMGLEGQALTALRTQIDTTLTAGDTALAADLFDDATAAYTRVLELEPGNERGSAGQLAVAQRRLAYAEDQVAQGEAALGEGHLAVAREAFEAAQRLEPNLKAAVDGLAKIEALVASLVTEELQWARRSGAAGRLNEAREHYQKALQLREDESVRAEIAALDEGFTQKIASLVREAERFAGQHEFQRARNIYQQVLNQIPDHADATLQLAKLEEEASQVVAEKLAVASGMLADGKYRQAVDTYRQVLDVEPGNTFAMQGLDEGRKRSQTQLHELLLTADGAMKDQDWSRADDYYHQVLKLDPYQRSAKAGIEKLEALRHQGLQAVDIDKIYLDGIKYYTGGKYAEAIAAWQQVLQLNPEHDKARRNLEKAQRKQQFIKERQNG